jgi:hypothetical protein
MSKAFTSRISPQEDWATVPADLRRLAATLAWRKHGPEAVVPVMALIEPPAALVPAFAPASRYPLLSGD